MKKLLQALLDRAEDFCARRRWISLTFHVIGLKSRLGLNIHR